MFKIDFNHSSTACDLNTEFDEIDTYELPASFAQQRVWFLEQLNPGSAAYHMAGGVKLKGELDVEALRASLDQLVGRHEALRTCFGNRDGQTVQIIQTGSGRYDYSELDLRSEPTEQRRQRAEQERRQQARRPFDLERGPLLRVELLRLSEDEHELLVTMHHIISDGWSLGVFVKQLAAGYAARQRGEGVEARGEELQYADWAAWQREWMSGEVLAEELRWWREELGGELGVLELPCDRVRPAMGSNGGRRVEVRVGREATRGLKGMSRSEGATQFMVVLAAYKVMLQRYSGQTDIVVGTPVAGRNQTETEELIGLFVNTLALRTEVRGEEGFVEVVRRVKEVALAAYAHQDVPFEKVVEEMQPEREMGRAPIFQVMFSLNGNPIESLALPGLAVSLIEIDTESSKCDLTLSLSEAGEELSGYLEYSTDLFDESTIIRMAQSFQTLIDSLVRHPERRIDELPLLSNQQRQHLLHQATGPRLDFDSHRLVHHLIADQARLHPHHLAVSDAAVALSFAELDGRANQLARFLRARAAAAPETVVALLLRRSPAQVVAALATLKTGAAYLPIDPAYPPQRIAYMLADAGASLVISEAELTGLLDPATVPVIELEAIAEALAGYSRGPLGVAVDSANPAYLIYTSGSTGQPKGVVVTHANLLNLIHWHGHRYQISSADRASQMAGPGFDASVWELWPHLAYGASVQIADEATRRSPEALQEWLLGERISIGFVPTPMAEQLMKQAWPEAVALPRLLTGGERLQGRPGAGSGLRVINHYGPTEATVLATAGEVSGEQEGSPSLGQAVANTRVYVLDERFEVRPEGVGGEIYIGGAGVGRGYQGRSAETAAAYVPDPYGESGERMYRTGDRGRYVRGEVEYLGRGDEQVKVRGYRIELGEVEGVIKGVGWVKEGVVVVRESEKAGKRLEAYVVLKEAREGWREELKRELEGRLPEYMVPRRVEEVEEIARTANGKVDRERMKREAGEEAREAEEVRIKGVVEEIVEGIWSEQLGRERMGRDENFFEAGGHSLVGTAVMSRVKEAMGVEVGLKVLFETATLGAFAAAVEAAMGSSTRLSSPPIRKVDRSIPPVASFGQERIHFLETLVPGTALYHMAGGVKLKGELDVEALRASLDQLVGRHEALRTCFGNRDGQTVQIIQTGSGRYDYSELDLSSEPAEQRRQRAEQERRQQARRPFDLERGPLLRVELLRLSEDEHELLVTMHHIISDGWSLGVFVKQLAAGYAARQRGEGVEARGEELQYADWAAWQREWMSGEVLAEELRWWREELGGEMGVLELPCDRVRPAMGSNGGGRVEVRVGREATRGLKGMSRSEGATQFMVVLAAYKVMLQRYSGQTDIIVGTLIANRNRKEIEDLIGFFINALALRTEVRGEERFVEVVRRVKEVALAAYAHQDVPFEKVVEEMQPEREMGRAPIFQVMFSLNGNPIESLVLPGLAFEPLPADVETTPVDLTLSLSEAGEELIGYLEYSTDLFDESTIIRMAENFTTLVDAIVANPQGRVADFPLLTESQRRHLLKDWNETASYFPLDHCFHQLFENQAALTPDAPAVICGNRRLTYSELNSAANRLAWALVSRDIGPDSIVGLLVERSIELLTAILAVFKAGGAYLPLDPAHPHRRIRQIVEQSGSRIVLTSGRYADDLQTALSPIAETNRPLVLSMDRLADEFVSEADLPLRCGPKDLAYVIFTSGSTGLPKGAMVEHVGMLNHLYAKIQDLRITETDLIAQTASQCFDISVWQFLSTLLVGGQVTIFDDETTHDPALLFDRVEQQQVTLLEVVPSLLRAMLDEATGSHTTRRPLDKLRYLIVTGEALPPELAANWLKTYPRIPLLNAYGPTECSDDVTHFFLDDAPSSDALRMPIGRPVANMRMYVLDCGLAPVPVGVAGELYVGGCGVGRGYIKDPARTAEVFIPDPFGTEAGARLYKTGDLVRYVSDGNLEFLGRIDQQVKVRGYRIELGEIEAMLDQHPAVGQSVVLVREDATGDRQIVAYVVPRQSGAEEGDGGEINADQVSQWQVVFETFYQQNAADAEEKLNLSGWNSSYTGQPIPECEMREWVEHTVAKILAERPARVLEPGCGAGLLLERIAPHCEKYWGTDFAPESIRFLKQRLASKTDLHHQVEILQRGADNFEGIEPDSFDAVILNSVVQYFPSIDYLLSVLEQAVQAVAPGGFIYIGDVRSLPLLEAFHLSLQLHQADAAMTRDELRQLMQTEMAREQELIIDPGFFHALREYLPRIADVKIQLKRGIHQNEMTRFRFDVLLRIGDGHYTHSRAQVLEWGADLSSVDEVRQKIEGLDDELLTVRRIPNARLRREALALEWLKGDEEPATIGEWRNCRRYEADTAIEPEAFWALSRQLPYSVEISGQDYGPEGYFDATFRRQNTGWVTTTASRSTADRKHQPDWRQYANNPLKEAVASRLVPQLRGYLKEKLPEYMVPSFFVTMDTFPLTRNGKIDRRRLPAVDGARRELQAESVPPRTETEARIASIWKQVLGADQVGVTDKFFEFGGDSLKLVRVFRLLNDSYPDAFTVVDLFKHTTIESLSRFIDEHLVANELVGAVEGFEF